MIAAKIEWCNICRTQHIEGMHENILNIQKNDSVKSEIIERISNLSVKCPECESIIRSNKMKEIEDKIKLVVKELLEKFPNVSYTIKILLWNDNDYMVTATHGDSNNNIIHSFEYYSQKLYVEYVSCPFLEKAIKEDKFGNKYYIPDELIMHLNKNRDFKS